MQSTCQRKWRTTNGFLLFTITPLTAKLTTTPYNCQHTYLPSWVVFFRSSSMIIIIISFTVKCFIIKFFVHIIIIESLAAIERTLEWLISKVIIYYVNLVGESLSTIHVSDLRPVSNYVLNCKVNFYLVINNIGSWSIFLQQQTNLTNTAIFSIKMLRFSLD